MSEWWHEKALTQLSPAEWETLCDGCAKCCLHKLEDEDSGEVFYTRVRCQYLDEQSCRCSDYAHRLALEPDCIELRPDSIQELAYLPASCAYRLRAAGKPLPDWHHLVCRDAAAVHRAGASVRGRSISAHHVHPDAYEEHIVQWV